MFCPQCGEKLDEGTKFCVKCGNKVDGGIPSAQPVNQYTMPPAQGIPQNSASYTANKTVTCQGCLLKEAVKCKYYDCIIPEAEKYDCGMRGAPEQQKKQKDSRIIQYFVELGLYALYGWLVLAKIAILSGINFWVIFVPGILIAYAVEYFIKQNIYKKRRENAKRL